MDTVVVVAAAADAADVLIKFWPRPLIDSVRV